VAAAMAMMMHQYDLDPQTGAENMRFLAGIKNDDTRMAADNALPKEGKSPDLVKAAVRSKPTEEDPQQRLEKEKQRLERTIASLNKRLEEVSRELDELN
jgi:hypothetical protein